jgi:predicted DCC family thiol-disulfide oxidoreductase YuxK
MPAGPNPIMLYDGVCGLCNRTVQFVLRHDRDRVFRFAALQSPFATEILRRHRLDPAQTDTVVVVIHSGQPDEKLLCRSDAVVYALRNLAPPWTALGAVGGVVPRFIRDALYRLVAANRYQLFGKYTACPLPAPGVRDRFLDVDSASAEFPGRTANRA